MAEISSNSEVIVYLYDTFGAPIGFFDGASYRALPLTSEMSYCEIAKKIGGEYASDVFGACPKTDLKILYLRE